MDYSTVVAQIKKGHVQPIYLLYGEETYLIRKIERTIVETVLTPAERDMNLVVLEHDPKAQELVNLIETVPFMGGKNLIIVRGTAFFKARRGGNGDQEDEPSTNDQADERLIKIFATMPEYSHVIFITTDKVDKRRKLYKTLEKNGVAVELAPLKPKEVRPWLMTVLAEMQKKMAPDALEHFLAVISVMPQVSLGFLENELEKLFLYTGKNPLIAKKDVIEVLSAVPEVSIFVMLEAISQLQVKKAVTMLNEQLAIGEHPLKIIALLAREVRLLWQTKDMLSRGYTSKQVAENIGVPPFVGDMKVRQSKSFTADKLKQALLSLAKAEQDLKSERAGGVVLEKIIIEMCL